MAGASTKLSSAKSNGNELKNGTSSGRPLERAETAPAASVDCNVKPENRPTLRRPSLLLSPKPSGRDEGVERPGKRGMRRGLTSPPTVFAQRPSASPPNSSTPQFLSPTTSHHQGSLSNPLSRRSSWQPGRRLYDNHEADNELPDEAILENIPMAGFPTAPAEFRFPRSLSSSPHRHPSPPMLSPVHSTLHSAKVPRNAKRPTGPPLSAGPRSPRHSGRIRPPRSLREIDLNEESRQLSAALAEYSERISSENANSSPPRDSSSKSRPVSLIIDRNQIQKGNIMIDPLPISKEKEAVLSRTRPSWLPPKDQKEERRHMKQWEQMMAHAAEAERKKAQRLKIEAENREIQQNNIARVWNDHVIPRWDAAVREPRTRELWWRGVASGDRSLVWSKAVGNDLRLSRASFTAALGRAAELEQQMACLPHDQRGSSKEAGWFTAIQRDVPNVFPELQLFRPGSPAARALTDVLTAYAMYRPDVGYVFGTHLIAGLLCVHMQAPDAFVTLANLLNRPAPLAFLVHDQVTMTRTYEMVLAGLKDKLPSLHAHLTSSTIGLQPDEFLDPIFRCLFAYHLRSEHVSRIFDIYVFEGDLFLMRAAVAALGHLESKLYGSREEILQVIGWSNESRWDLGSEDDFITEERKRDEATVSLKSEMVGV
ncbi:hypothetical protein K470DRAFT_280214 [Piedraia hortae CBS 480.64]|uniref:Rab-GAP TBC domain-containing protein n=1 Tax=Piedraia hortae CBS 480.64 TaxID=1314780 RepID=A0A6A7C985_9PEZI|nr:hypothetical protein K470DRAFT_280214 [Piedraia hortae CBS 480.64]